MIYFIQDKTSGECMFLGNYPNNETAIRSYRYHFKNCKDFYILDNIKDFILCYYEYFDVVDTHSNYNLNSIDLATIVDPEDNVEFKKRKQEVISV